MGRLAKANIPAFLIYGNHDAENQITKRLTLPDNVRVFPSKKAATIRLDRYGVAVHGQSFKLRAVTENLVAEYPTPVTDLFNIGILHTGLGGMHGHANYAPCSLDDLINKGYDYWALAHVHQGAILHRDPYVVFCGNLQGRHIREDGVKSATLVSVEDGAVQEVSRIEADVGHFRKGGLTVRGRARRAVAAAIGELVRKLPHEVKAGLEDGILKAAADGDHSQVIERASRYLRARLGAEGV
jgi:DNA repair protein SbcD/Mre11